MTQFLLLLKKCVRHPIFLAAAVTFLAVRIFGSSVFISRVDLVGRDLFFQLRYALRKPPPEVNNLVLVAIDDVSTQKLKDRWPFPRAIYGDAISKISAFQPKVIGFDFIFQGEDKVPGSDEILRQALLQAGNVVLASYLDHEGRLISAHPTLRVSAFRTALVNKMMDRDGVVRRAPLLLKDSEANQNHLSWEPEIFLKAAGIESSTFVEGNNQLTVKASTGEIKIPAPRGMLDIDYTVKPKDVPTVSFWQVLEGKIDPSWFKQKIVLTGLTALALHDFHATPLKILPGLVINANVILTLIRQNFLVRVPLMFTWILIFLTVWLVLLVTERYAILTSFLIVFTTVAIYFVFDFLMLWWNIIWDLSYAVLISLLTYFVALLYKQVQTALENIRLREESVRDPLTGFYTRRFLEVHLKLDVKKVLSASRGFGAIEEVSVVMIDLDNFKLVNDSFGHQEGDRVLKKLGVSIRSAVRKDELVCRYGGDEFCVILPGTALQNAVQFSEKLRMLIASDPELNYTTQAGVRSFRVTGSFGVASVKGNRALTAENLLKASDRALYRAKTGGRNQVCAYDPARDVIEEK